jgi:hypothetical protein
METRGFLSPPFSGFGSWAEKQRGWDASSLLRLSKKLQRQYAAGLSLPGVGGYLPDSPPLPLAAFALKTRGHYQCLPSYSNCQKFFPLIEALKPPLPLFKKGGEMQGIAVKVPLF